MGRIGRILRKWFANRNEGSQERQEAEHTPSLSLTRTLRGLRDAVGDLDSVKRELREYAGNVPPIQARLFVEAAGVLRVIAETFSSALQFSPTSEQVIASNALTLYHKVLTLIQKARHELAHPSHRREPVCELDLISMEEVCQADLLLLQETAQNLEDTYRIDVGLSDKSQDRLKELLVQLESRMDFVLPFVSDDAVDGEISESDQLWLGQMYDEIFGLWVLIAQELVCPGIAESVGFDADEMDPNDVWLMTDPVAQARYEQEGKLEQLERDIRYEVMRGEAWHPEDIEYLQQVKLLEARKIIQKLASFWSVSPHSSIYRALRGGVIRIGGQSYPFKKDQEIVWVCPMTRDVANLDAPVLIDDLQSQRVRQLCGVMSNAMMGRGVQPMDSQHSVMH